MRRQCHIGRRNQTGNCDCLAGHSRVKAERGSASSGFLAARANLAKREPSKGTTMPEPLTTITAGVIGYEVVKEGIKFLFNQASECLKWWHEKKSTPEKAPKEPAILEVPDAAFANRER